MAPVIEALRRGGRLRVETIHTGQHEQMADQVFRVFRIPVRHNFNIMTADQSVGQVLAHTIERADRLFRRRRPQALLVQGVTASAFGLGLAGHLHRLEALRDSAEPSDTGQSRSGDDDTVEITTTYPVQPGV